jgi:hypothetical protein
VTSHSYGSAVLLALSSMNDSFSVFGSLFRRFDVLFRHGGILLD